MHPVYAQFRYALKHTHTHTSCVNHGAEFIQVRTHCACVRPDRTRYSPAADAVFHTFNSAGGLT